jgi:putative flavoprotein involved in K+ transport
MQDLPDAGAPAASLTFVAFTPLDNTNSGVTVMSHQHIETLVIGAGQAGLSTAYHLKRIGRQCLVVDANERVGDNWRRQWDTLRLYTPAKYDGLPGLPFPGEGWHFPGKDEVADYLERYALHWDLPVRMSTRVDRLEARPAGGYVAVLGDERIDCDNVVVATGTFGRTPMVPGFADQLDPGIRQLVFVFRHVLTRRTPMGRKAMNEIRFHGGLNLRVKREDLTARGVERVTARVVGVSQGRPMLEGGRIVDCANVIWATGFRQVFDWIRLPILDENGWPREYRGLVDPAPGLFFCGLSFQFAFSSMLFPGVGRDAAHVARQIAARAPSTAAVAA